MKTFLKKFRKTELLFGGICFLYFISIGWIFAKNTQIVYHPSYICDLYFGFDNGLHNTSFIRHPLYKVISLILKKTFFWVEDVSYLIIVICGTLLTGHLLLIKRFFREIIGLSAKSTIVLLCFYLLFSTPLILSFTYESYPYSAFLLMLCIYVVSKNRIKAKKISSSWFYALCFLIGGITITNLAKVMLSIYDYPKKLVLQWSLKVLIFTLFIYLIFWNQGVESVQHFISINKVSTDVFKDSIFNLFGGNILFPDLIIQPYQYDSSTTIPILLTNTTNNFLKQILTIIILIMMLVSIYIHRIDGNIKMLVYFLSVDIFLHVILKIGLTEASIYGGNFIFIVPLIIGYFIHHFEQKKWSSIYIIPLILAIFIGYINFNTLYTIYQFGIDNYPK